MHRKPSFTVIRSFFCRYQFFIGGTNKYLIILDIPYNFRDCEEVYELNPKLKV